jgi:subtilisin family serine protease
MTNTDASRFILALLAAGALVLGSDAAHAQLLIRHQLAQSQNVRAEQPEVYEGVIVKFKPAMAASALSVATHQRVQQTARVGLRNGKRMAMGAVVYPFNGAVAAAEVRAAAARLSLEPDVEYAVPNRVMYAHQVAPTDPLFNSNQWPLHPTPGVAGGANLMAAWSRTTGSTSVVVAVLDSGVRLGHPDLAGRLVPGYDFVSGDRGVAVGVPANWYSADGDGRDADPTDPGDYVDAALLAQLPPAAGITSTSDSSWHGTHVAGTIGATSNNSVGITGVDWSARILPVRVLGRGGSGSTADIVDGIAWAAGLTVAGAPLNQNPARVINLSLGGGGSCNPLYQDLINAVRANGAIVIASAGNSYGSPVSQPANCNGVIAVAAGGKDGDLALYSNVGPEAAITAPGGGCGVMAYTGAEIGEAIWDAIGCVSCHTTTTLRAQISARAPVGLTGQKAFNALNAALTGTDLDGQATGMGGLSALLGSLERTVLASYLADLPACTGPSDGVTSTVNTSKTIPGAEGYGALAGTSMAAPHVSGVVALMLSLSPQLSANEVRSVLQTTARAHPVSGYCSTVNGTGKCGAGLLDAGAAVAHVANNRPTVAASVSSGATVVRPAASFTLLGTATAAGGRLITPGSSLWDQQSGPTVSITSALLNPQILTAPAFAGQLGFRFTATDNAGYSASATTSVTVNSPPAMNPAGPIALTAGTPAGGGVTGVDPDGDTITYVLTSGPPGLTMSAANGQWSWTPNTVGTFTMTVMPADSVGNGTAMSYTLNVAAPASPPSGSANAPSSGGGGTTPAWIVPLLILATIARRRLGVAL